MVTGIQIETKTAINIKGIIVWIKNVVMENILATRDGFTKGIFKMILEMDLGNYFKIKSLCIEGNGEKVIKCLKNRLMTLLNYQDFN